MEHRHGRIQGAFETRAWKKIQCSVVWFLESSICGGGVEWEGA